MLPPATIAEGVLGREGYLVWNGFSINVMDGSWPRYKIDEITGLWDKPDADNNSAPNTARDGETMYPSALRGKTVVYTGLIIAQNLPQLRVAMNNYKKAFTGNALGFLTIKPPVARGGVEWTSVGRVLSATATEVRDLPEGTRPSPWQAEFVLSIRLPVAHFLETTAPQSVTNAMTAVCLNLGTAPAYPKITVVHDGGDVNVLNLTTGKALRFKLVPAGTIVIDFTKREAIALGVLDAVNYLDDPNSSWWDELVPGMPPGNNSIKQEGGSSITVEWNHTSY